MKTTEIAFILDRSGSMQPMIHAAVSGFNEFLQAQQTTLDDHGKPIPATFSLILFDQEYQTIYDRQDIQTVQPLTLQTYVPRGMTALQDAIGRTIDHIGKELDATPKADRPAKVIIAILTDGEENASQHFSMEDINELITRQTKIYNWEFMFLGANQDAIATAASMGIQACQAATFSAHADDLHASNDALSIKISVARKLSAMCRLNDEEVINLQASMSETLNKSRKEKK